MRVSGRRGAIVQEVGRLLECESEDDGVVAPLVAPVQTVDAALGGRLVLRLVHQVVDVGHEQLASVALVPISQVLAAQLLLQTRHLRAIAPKPIDNKPGH